MKGVKVNKKIKVDCWFYPIKNNGRIIIRYAIYDGTFFIQSVAKVNKNGKSKELKIEVDPSSCKYLTVWKL